MKVAILSDIHGNSISLEAVLDDIERRGGVNGYWFVGDYCALGFDPVGVLQRVQSLPNAVFVRGNTDRYVTDQILKPPLASALENVDLVPVVVGVAQGFSWTQGMVTAVSQYNWLKNLSLEHRLVLPDGTRVLLVHAAPGDDDGLGVRRDHTNDDLQRILDECEADLVFVGHTHIPLDKTVGGIRVVNVGAISNPHMPDLRATYVLLQADEAGYALDLHWVDYDREAVISAIRCVHYPAPDYLIGYFQGKVISNIFKQK